MLSVGSLFSGIGGLDLGLERAGMRVVWQAETDPYASAILRRHWPSVPNLGDVRAIDQNTPRVDLICGGFPCQDISFNGKGAGIAHGTRSGLWYEFDRIIGALRPDFVLVENVGALLRRGMSRVLGDLAALRYDAEWYCIPAAAVGAPHYRERIFVIAYDGRRVEQHRPVRSRQRSRNVPDADRERLGELGERNLPPTETKQSALGPNAGRSSAALADPAVPRFARWISEGLQECSGQLLPRARGTRGRRPGWWDVEPAVGRVVDGIPDRVDRLRCIGNAVVPQVAEVIGRAIIAHKSQRR